MIDREGIEVVLLPRPRRFGKTLNLSMLRCFFEKREEDLTPLFEDLHIWSAGDAYRAHFQRYPVLYMTFKGITHTDFDHCWEAIKEKVIDLYDEHRYLLDGGGLGEIDARRYLLQSYWVATSSNDLIQDLLQHHALALDAEIEALLAGGAVERRLDENVVLADLRKSEGALWSLLVMSGYLKAEPAAGEPGEVPPYRLSIPNREVREVYLSTFRSWIESRLAAGGGSVERLKASLLRGDAEAFERQLQAFVTDLLSYHDTASVEPERIYHAFVLGLLATLEPAYQVRSNRESGQGRSDVMIRPAQVGKPGAVLELKVVRPPRGTLEEALEEAVKPIRQKDYAAELRASGAAPVHAFAVAFDGKVIRARAADA